MSLFSCTGTRPDNLGIKDGRLANCPASPNCVSSDAPDSTHFVAPFQLSVPAVDGWRTLRATLENWPRAKIVVATPEYLHAECSSAVFGFVDDLELHLRAAQNTIAVRSASRLGYGDFGVNRKRVEELRRRLQKAGVIR